MLSESGLPPWRRITFAVQFCLIDRRLCAGAAAGDFAQALKLEPGNKEAAVALDRLKPPPKPEQP